MMCAVVAAADAVQAGGQLRSRLLFAHHWRISRTTQEQCISICGRSGHRLRFTSEHAGAGPVAEHAIGAGAGCAADVTIHARWGAALSRSLELA